MANGRIPLGKVAFLDRGTYSDTAKYMKFDFITTADSTYYSKQDNNTGHPLTDKSWWGCLASGAGATEAAEKAMEATQKADEAATKANDKAVKANEAAVNANGNASLAQTATNNANAAAANALQAKLGIDDVMPEVRNAITNAQNAYNLATSIEGADKFSQRPSGMMLDYDKMVPVGATPKIKVFMYPTTAQTATVFALSKAFGEVDADGVVTSESAGAAKINVFSTVNAQLRETVTITFREAVARTTEDGQTRTTEDGQTLYV